MVAIDVDSSATRVALATFSIVGVGFGVTGVVLTHRVGGGAIVGGVVSVLVLAVAVLVGPVLAAVVGLTAGRGDPVGTFVGSTIGYVVMTLLVVLCLGAAGGGGDGDVGRWLLTVVLLAIPTGLVGSATELARDRVGG